MKQYPKRYDDISRKLKPDGKLLKNMGSSYGTLEDLADRFRSFYHEAHPILFDLLVKQVWLEQKFLYDGARRANRGRNGMGPDWTFSHFMRVIVGISQKPLTSSMTFIATPKYFKDFFPNFSDHDPFIEPEYFKYPYKHVTLDHMTFVYQCHNRLDMLQEAEDKLMKIQDFRNWVTNWVYSYNDEVGDIIYRVTSSDFYPYIKKMK